MVDAVLMAAKKRENEEGKGAFHTITFRCPADLVEALDEKALQDDRSRGNLIVHLLRKCLNKPATSATSIPPED